MANINRVIITGNLTADPERRGGGDGGTTVTQLRVAVNHRRRNDSTGEWVEEPNYFDVTVFGAQAESCATYLSKGRPVAIDGRLRWSQWEAKDGSGKRQKVDIVAQTVQFLGSRGDNGGGSSGGAGNGQSEGFRPAADVPADTSDFDNDKPAGVASGGGGDDDIPF